MLNEANVSYKKKFCNWLKYGSITAFTRETQYPVQTIIENPVLAWFNIIGKVALFAYLIYAFIWERHYLQLAVPKLHVNYWRGKDEIYYSADNFSYCNNDTYDFTLRSDWDYSDADCISLVYGDSYSKGDTNFFFFPTFLQLTSEVRLRNCHNDSQIFYNRAFSYSNCRFLDDGLDKVCDCQAKKNYMVMGVENIHFIVSLAYYISETGETGATGDNDVRAVVKNHEGKIIDKFDSTQSQINYTIGEWLEAAGINLDELNDGIRDANESSPFWRTTGVNLIIDVQFYNLPTLHGIRAWQYKKVAVVDIRHEPGWASTGSQIMWFDYPDHYLLESNGSGEYDFTDSYEYGVKFFFLGSGYIGRVTWKAIQDYIVSSIVLLSIIPTVVAYLGMRLFGFNSEIYSEQLRQHPDGIIRDMEIYLETFNYLFGKYMNSHTSESTVCGPCLSCFWDYICPGFSSGGAGSIEVITIAQFIEFCDDRKIDSNDRFLMWSEINNDPLLATKKFFTSKTLWNAVRRNYDKASQRVEVEGTTIQRMWRKWDIECHRTKSVSVYQDPAKNEYLNPEVIKIMEASSAPSKIRRSKARKV